MASREHLSASIPTTWKPTKRELVVWNVLALVVFLVSISLFTFLAIGSGSAQIGFGDMIWTLAIVVVGLAAHEFIHGIAFASFGGRPRFGAKMMKRVTPVLYCTAPGALFTRSQFLVIVLAPLVVINGLGIVLIQTTDIGGWLVVPLAVNMSGAIGDLWIAAKVSRLPAGTRVEDMEDGVRFHPPAPAIA